jgi:iron complex outermembrane receptor protein
MTRFAAQVVHGFLFVLIALVSISAFAQETGVIEGKVARGKKGIGAVSVVVNETGDVALTDGNGNYRITGLAPGTYTLTFSLGDNRAQETGVVVSTGQAIQVETSVDWAYSLVETVTVYSASRRAERIVEAPQAVSVITEEVIEQQASHGQVPKLLEFTPGVEVTQSGVYDYNINTRGFNSSLNRRVATLIDGRNPSVPFLGAQEWSAFSYPLDDIGSLELARGPSAALYGANASSGIISIKTKEPRYSQGLMVRVTGGDLSTKNADLRYATELGGGWYLKATGGYRDTEDFSLSRNGAAEYSVPCTMTGQTDCLPQELLPLQRRDNKIQFGTLRADKYIGENMLLTFEGGLATVEGPAFQTGIGRVQFVDVERSWGRANLSGKSWDAMVFYNKRNGDEQRSLASGLNLVLNSENIVLEGQKRFEFSEGKVRWVIGASYKDEEIDTFDPALGRHSLMFEAVDADFTAVFSQLEIQAAEKVKLVFAARFDDSSLHDSQFSPKAALVYTPVPNHSVRLTYNEAFQVANYSEFFLQADVDAPLDLSAIEGICTVESVDCGFGTPTRVLAVGNRTLDLEEISTIEIGYTGIINEKTMLTFDVYRSDNENFITDLIPQFDAMFNVTNPNFGSYTPPAALSPAGQATLVATLMGALGPSFAVLSNNLDDSPFLIGATYKNFGQVDTTGADLGVQHYFNENFSLNGSFSWFDFDIADPTASLANQLQPNTPEKKFTVGGSYTADSWNASASARWVDDFRWVVGPFQGLVESYTTVDLNANYDFSDKWSIGIGVANALDDGHWESFGGDIIGRRALLSLTFRNE